MTAQPYNDSQARTAALAVALVAVVLLMSGMVGRGAAPAVQAQTAPTPALAQATQRPIYIIITPTAPPEHQEAPALAIVEAAPTSAPQIVYVDRPVVQVVEVPVPAEPAAVAEPEAAAYPCDQVCVAYKNLPTLALTNDPPATPPAPIDPRQLEWSRKRTR